MLYYPSWIIICPVEFPLLWTRRVAQQIRAIDGEPQWQFGQETCPSLLCELCGSYCGYAKNAAWSIRRTQRLIGRKRRHSRPLLETALLFLTSSPCSATSSPGLSPCLLSLMADSANLPCPGRQGLRHAVFGRARIIRFAQRVGSQCHFKVAGLCQAPRCPHAHLHYSTPSRISDVPFAFGLLCSVLLFKLLQTARVSPSLPQLTPPFQTISIPPTNLVSFFRDHSPFSSSLSFAVSSSA